MTGRNVLRLSFAAWVVALFPTVGRAQPPAFAPASLYATMFDPATVWVFRVETSLEQGDPSDAFAKPVREKQVDSATCHVTKVVRWAKSIGSHIKCTGGLARGQVSAAVNVADGFLEGDWVATARGLWHFDASVLDGPEPAVAPDDVVILAKPAAAQRKKDFPEPEGGGFLTRIWRHGNTWCAIHDVMSGDELGSIFCWAPTGLIGGKRYFSGGEYREVLFCLDEPVCRMLSTPRPWKGKTAHSGRTPAAQ
jgi:hypothetical protein